MFEKLQAASKIIILPAVILYVGGFICITGFLARFGFVTFDVVNARFLIAGLHALLPLSYSLWLSWTVYKVLVDKTLYTYAGFPRRLLIYSELIVTPSVAAIAFNALYTAADFSKMSDPDAFQFGPFGSWDIVGSLLRHAHGFGFKLAVYLSVYGSVIFVPLYVLATLYLGWRAARRKAPIRDESQTLSGQEDSSGHPPPTKSPRVMEFFQSPGIAAKGIVFTGDVVAICIMIAAGIDSYWRIRSEILDADTISHLRFTTNLLQAWFYLTNFSILFFLLVSPSRPTQLTLANFGKWLTPSNMPDASRFAAPILASLFLFGAAIFPRVPVAIGGGMPREVSVSLKVPTPPLAQGSKYLLAESSQFIFVVQLNGRQRRAYQLNKDVVAAIETWQDFLPPPKPHNPALAHARRNVQLPRKNWKGPGVGAAHTPKREARAEGQCMRTLSTRNW